MRLKLKNKHECDMGGEENRQGEGSRATIFVGNKSGREGFWRSFENDERLSGVKRRIQTRCIPCIENLFHQLKAGQTEIEIGNAYDCWKVVAVLESENQCEEILEQYQRMFLPAHHIQGRYGSHAKDGTRAIVLNADGQMERDLLFSQLKECMEKCGLDGDILITRGCANLYGQLLGDWQGWRRVSTVCDKQKIAPVVEILERYLSIA